MEFSWAARTHLSISIIKVAVHTLTSSHCPSDSFNVFVIRTPLSLPIPSLSLTFLDPHTFEFPRTPTITLDLTGISKSICGAADIGNAFTHE